jgi:predicted amidohydrolase
MKIQVLSIQLGIKERSKEETLAYVLELLNQARGGDLILLPEIWLTGYFAFSRYREQAESVGGPSIQALRKKAMQVKIFLFTGSFVEADGPHLFNTSLLIDPKGEILARYRKIHLFGYQSDESRLLQRGSNLAIAQLPWGKTGLTTCYDLRFPELYRKLIEEGVQCFLVTSAWPKARLEAWTLFNRARAHENLSHLFSCNCAGQSEGRIFGGHSMFVDPLGQIAAEAGEKEELLSAEIDTDMAAQIRNDFPALNDRVFK